MHFYSAPPSLCGSDDYLSEDGLAGLRGRPDQRDQCPRRSMSSPPDLLSLAFDELEQSSAFPWTTAPVPRHLSLDFTPFLKTKSSHEVMLSSSGIAPALAVPDMEGDHMAPPICLPPSYFSPPPSSPPALHHVEHLTILLSLKRKRSRELSPPSELDLDGSQISSNEQEEDDVDQFSSGEGDEEWTSAPAKASSSRARASKRRKGTSSSRASTGKKTWTCDQLGDACGKTFKRLEHLKRHELTHGSDKPFSCDWPGCEKDFGRADNLMQHRRTHDKPNSRNNKKASANLAQGA